MTRPILLCGNEPALLGTRNMVLERAGFVTSICSEHDIASMPHTPPIALTVLGHSMSKEDVTRTANLVRTKWPHVKILFLTKSDDGVVKTAPDEYKAGSSNPSHLIQTCQAILDGSV